MWQSIKDKINVVLFWILAIALCLAAWWILRLENQLDQARGEAVFYKAQYELCAGVKGAIDDVRPGE